MSRYTLLLTTLIPLAVLNLHAETLTLSMEAAIAAALDRNFSIRVERFEPAVAGEAVREAQGQYDPVFQSQYLYSQNELAGFSRDQESSAIEVGVSSRLPWGTELGASIRSNDQTTPFDPVTNEFSESISTSVGSFAGITVTQPVLRGFGWDSNHAPVRIAMESSEAAWETFRAQVMDTVEATIASYQNLYFAQQNLRIAERNRDLALQLLKDNQKRVETGAMAPLDIVQAESEAALRDVSVISARAFLGQAMNGLKALIWDDPQSVLDLELKILPPREPEAIEVNASRDYGMAMKQLPEYLASQYGLNIRELQLRQLDRDSLPQLDLVGSAGRRAIRDSLGTSLGDAFSEGESSITIGAVFSMPFPNRTRSAQKTQAFLRRNQAEVSLQQLEQSIRLELDNAAIQMQADWDRIQAARRARELAEKSLQAEEKKLQVGTSTTFVVLRLQGDLATAEIRETNALTDYRISLARYHRARGSILDLYNITLDRRGPQNQ